MRILYSADPLNDKTVDEEYKAEHDIAGQLGIQVDLVSLEELLAGNPLQAVRRVQPSAQPEAVIYRGWMLKPEHYEALFIALQSKGLTLINTPEQYVRAHYFPGTYEWIQEITPYSIWVEKDQVLSELQSVLQRLELFGGKPVIIKDYVKSRKHEWTEACYIPDASDLKQAETVIRNFIARQADQFSGGLVIREFVELEQLSQHPVSGMPLAREYRMFFLNHKLLIGTAYWDEAAYTSEMPDWEPFIKLAERIPSSFFSLDIARAADGSWKVIEVGDGQVSGLSHHADIRQFYTSILSIMD